jgi:hypothetical protein
VSPDIPGDPHEALVLADWPAHPERMSTLLADLGDHCSSSPARLPGRWCAESASASPSRVAADQFILRRRQTMERVRCRLLTEDCCVAAEEPGSA